MPDPASTDTGTGPDVGFMLGQIVAAMKLDVAPDAPAATILQAILEACTKMGESEQTAEASEKLRTVFKLAAESTVADIVKAAEALVSKGEVTATSLKTLSERQAAIEASQAARDVDQAIKSQIEAGKISPKATPELLAHYRRLATTDLKGFAEFMSVMPRVIPAQGRMAGADEDVTPTTGREEIIKNGRAAFKTDRDARKLCSERAYVDDDLRALSLQRVTDDEATKLGIATELVAV